MLSQTLDLSLSPRGERKGKSPDVLAERRGKKSSGTRTHGRGGKVEKGESTLLDWQREEGILFQRKEMRGKTNPRRRLKKVEKTKG